MAYRPDAGDQQPPALKRRRNNPPTPTTGPIPQHTTRAFHQRGRVRLDEQVAFANQTLSFLPCHPGVNPPAGSYDNGVFVGSLSQLTAANSTLANTPFPHGPPNHPQSVEANFLMHYSGPTDGLNFQYAAPQPPFTEEPPPSSTENSHQPLPAPVGSWPAEDSAPIDGIYFTPTHYQTAEFAPALPWPSLYPQFSGLPGSQPPLVSEHVGHLGIGTDAPPTLYHPDACCSTAEPLSSQPGTFKGSGTPCLPSPPESTPSYHRDIQSPFSLHNEPQERQDFQVGQISNADAVAGIGQRFYGPGTPLYTASERSEPSEQSTGAAIGLTFPFPPECHYVGTEENNEPSVSDSLGTENGENPGESHNACSGSSKGKKPVIKACVRCRFQKQKCILDPTDPDGPCIPCQSISRTSKKTIHRTPCFHNKITDTVLFRSGGLGLTKRWTGTEMKNIVTPVQARNPRTIQFTQSAEQEPIVIKVVPFEPIEGDITSRFWTVIENGVVIQKSKEIKPFCLANIRRTAIYFEQYIRVNAIPDFRRRGAPGSRVDESTGNYDPIQTTYRMAVNYYDSLPDEVEIYEGGALVANREKRLLGNLFLLSFAIRQTTGSAYICGEDTLDMAPETDDPSYPLQGKVSLPRMLLAQFDSITHTKLLVPFRMKVLRELEYLIVQNKKRYWFTIYVCLFILLREASWITEDRSRHAKAVHQAKIRYSIPGFVESLQEGCNTLLMFWHYYNCRPMPTSADAAAQHASFLSELTAEQYTLVIWTMTNPDVQEQLSMWRTYRAENGFIPEPKQPHEGETAYNGNQRKLPWDHPYYWIAQLFEEDWTPHPTYKREYI